MWDFTGSFLKGFPLLRHLCNTKFVSWHTDAKNYFRQTMHFWENETWFDVPRIRESFQLTLWLLWLNQEGLARWKRNFVFFSLFSVVLQLLAHYEPFPTHQRVPCSTCSNQNSPQPVGWQSTINYVDSTRCRVLNWFLLRKQIFTYQVCSKWSEKVGSRELWSVACSKATLHRSRCSRRCKKSWAGVQTPHTPYSAWCGFENRYGTVTVCTVLNRFWKSVWYGNCLYSPQPLWASLLRTFCVLCHDSWFCLDPHGSLGLSCSCKCFTAV